MSEENKIAYYAVIPATVLFNKDIKLNEKLLYAVITILSNKEGYCFASNKYLSGLLDAQPHTVSRLYSPISSPNSVTKRGRVGRDFTNNNDITKYRNNKRNTRK